MRTVFIGAHENPNGVNSYTFNLALELKKRGFESFVMSFGSCNKVNDYKGVMIKQYKTPGGTMTSIPTLYIKSIPYLIKRRKEIDMVMYQTVQFSSFPAFIVRLFGIKTTTIIHSLAEDSPKHSAKMKMLLMSSMKIAMFFTKHIITVSHTKAEEVKDRYGRDCHVLPCGVYIPEDKEYNSEIMFNNGIKAGKFFLSIGRIDPIKNLETLIDAFKDHDHGEYQLVIGGDVNNDYGKSIVNRANGCKDIIFPGIVYGDSKATLLKNCMAYCLVSSSEGLPIALLEGMSYGKIPIVTRIPSIKEVLNEYNIGLWNDVQSIEELSNSMVKIEQNYEALKKDGEIAKQIVEDHYTWSQTCDKYLDLVNRLY